MSTIDIHNENLGTMQPHEILYELDFPMIFTFKDGGRLYLAYLIEESSSFLGYLVVPTNSAVINQLKSGHTSVRTALEQTWSWKYEIAPDTNIIRKSFYESPSLGNIDLLPAPDVMLYPELNPFLSIKFSGKDLTKNNILTSYVKKSIDSAYAALKKLSEQVAGEVSTTGRPANQIRKLYDLPFEQLAFNSVSLIFSEPNDDQQILPGSKSITDQMQSAAQLLEKTLEWAADDNNLDQELSKLEIVSKLSPPITGLIESVTISGRLFSSTRKFELNRESTRKIKEEIKKKRTFTEHEYKTIRGEARELDKDKMSFRLRDEKTNDEYICTFSEELYDDVMYVFSTEQRLEVTLETEKESKQSEVIKVYPI